MGQKLSFRKINSGTKADISIINQDREHNVYFLTDKIYKMEKDTWNVLDFPTEGKIVSFSPLTAKDIWFTVIPFTSTCILYHYHNGITENIRSPFANYITSMHFITEDKALFAGYSDVASYENGMFRLLPPAPSLSNIIKIYGDDLSTFWSLTSTGELFYFHKGIYQRILDGSNVPDFCFTDTHGYILSQDKLYDVKGLLLKPLVQSKDFLNISKLYLMKDGMLLLVGAKGCCMSYKDGHLMKLNVPDNETMSDVVATNQENVWICGRNGHLLYSGSRAFPAYNENDFGFSNHKLSSVGLSADDEYGVAMADFDGDTKTDIYTVRIYEQNRLYMNNITSPDFYSASSCFNEEIVKRNAIGSFTRKNINEQNILKLGINVADIDNDNDQDIYLCYLNNKNRLLLNKGNGYFRNVSDESNRACENLDRSNAAAFTDVDNDGDLDLFVTSENGTNRLFENDGSGHFRDITSTSGLSSINGGMCASFADVNNDGLADLCVSFWGPSNKLYINESKKGIIHFRDATSGTDLGRASPSKSNAVVFADVNNDGFIDLFIASRNTGNKLYINEGKGDFKDKTSDFFPSENFMSNGAVFADFDLDGYLDLYITNVGENVLYKNINGKYFEDVTASFGAELSGYCTGSAVGDVDNDGDPDLYAANYINGNSNLFLNITEKKSFVKLKLQGVISNRDAIGAKAWLYKVTGDNKSRILAGYRELNGGSGYASISAKEMIFGVEQGMKYFLLIKFPSSPDTLRFDHVVAGTTLDINELNGIRALYAKSRKSIIRFFVDQEKQPEIIKFVFVILLLVIYNLRLHRNSRKISIIHWLMSSFIFGSFAFVNQFFLFEWPTVSFFIPAMIVLGLLAIEYLYIDRILLKRLALTEKQELREKLSRDLHDDLASTLGSISIYAGTLKSLNEPSRPEFKKLPVKIAELTQTALQSISDIIWMTSPRNDSLQSLISKTSNYMLEILNDNQIVFLSNIEVPDEAIILPENIRNDSFLILKEAIHNIIKHSGAKNVEFSAILVEKHCTIILKDDGVGIREAKQIQRGSHGNGLINMRRRAQDSAIELQINSSKGAGTEIVIHFKI